MPEKFIGFRHLTLKTHREILQLLRDVCSGKCKIVKVEVYMRTLEQKKKGEKGYKIDEFYRVFHPEGDVYEIKHNRIHWFKKEKVKPIKRITMPQDLPYFNLRTKEKEAYTEESIIYEPE